MCKGTKGSSAGIVTEIGVGGRCGGANKLHRAVGATMKPQAATGPTAITIITSTVPTIIVTVASKASLMDFDYDTTGRQRVPGPGARFAP
jgi:hypothetical protein